MAEVMIRLKRIGGKKQPHNRVVVITKVRARNGRAIEELGTVDSRANPPVIKIDVERAKFWIGQGATPTPTVKQLMKKATARSS